MEIDKDDNIYLKHIIESISIIEEYIKDVDYQIFLNKRIIQDGVIRQLEIIGEASRYISNNIRDTYNQIPWKDMSAMRNKLIHNYFGVDLEAVWDTVTNDIKTLKKDILKINFND